MSAKVPNVTLQFPSQIDPPISCIITGLHTQIEKRKGQKSECEGSSMGKHPPEWEGGEPWDGVPPAGITTSPTITRSLNHFHHPTISICPHITLCFALVLYCSQLLCISWWWWRIIIWIISLSRCRRGTEMRTTWCVRSRGSACSESSSPTTSWTPTSTSTLSRQRSLHHLHHHHLHFTSPHSSHHCGSHYDVVISDDWGWWLWCCDVWWMRFWMRCLDSSFVQNDELTRQLDALHAELGQTDNEHNENKKHRQEKEKEKEKEGAKKKRV